jgi:hypothetical protein
MAKRAQSDTVQLNLRIKEAVRQKIEESAREHGISMNAEIVARLQRSLELDTSTRAYNEGVVDAIKVIEMFRTRRPTVLTPGDVRFFSAVEKIAKTSPYETNPKVYARLLESLAADDALERAMKDEISRTKSEDDSKT